MAAASFLKKIGKVLKSNPRTDDDTFFDDEYLDDEPTPGSIENNDDGYTADSEDGQLAVDVYSFGDTIYVKTMIAGVKKADLDIDLTREQVTIRGSRYDNDAAGDNYVFQELYWGSFSRTIELPEEVDIDHAKASEEHGLLTLELPKVDKERSTKLNIHEGKK